MIAFLRSIACGAPGGLGADRKIAPCTAPPQPDDEPARDRDHDGGGDARRRHRRAEIFDAATSASSSASSAASRSRAKSSRASSACSSGRRWSAATASACCSTATRSFRRCSMPSAAPSAPSPSRPTSTGRATSAAPSPMRCASDPRAGVAVHVLLDWIGSIKMARALIDEMETAGIEVKRFPRAGVGAPEQPQQPHAPQAARGRRGASASPAASASRRAGRATRKTPTIGATRTSGSKARWCSRCSRCFLDNWIEVSGDLLHGADYFPPAADSGDIRSQMFSSSPTGGCESMELMYLLAITAATRHDRSLGRLLRARPAAAPGVARSDRARRAAAHRRAGQAHRFEDRARRVACRLGRAVASRRDPGRVPADDVPLQGDDRRRPARVGRLDQLRQPVLPHQRRGDAQHPRPRVRQPADGDLRAGSGPCPGR